MILDTAGPLYNLHYLNKLGSPRTPNQRKFSEAVLSGKGERASSGEDNRVHDQGVQYWWTSTARR